MIGLKITIIKGSTTDNCTEYFFDHQHRYIVLGCDPAICHVSFSEKYKQLGIGNEHLAFKRSLGRYQIDLNTDHFVTIDGAIPFEDQELNGTATISLGEEIIIAIEVIDQRQQPHLSGKKILQPGAQVRKNTHYLRFALLVCVSLVVAIVFFNSNLLGLRSNLEVSEENIQRVVTNLKSLSHEVDRVERLSDVITQETINRVSNSVYLVLVRNSDGAEVPAGTAWVIDDKRLATNAHVAMIYESLKAEEELIVRASIRPYRTHVVSRIELHPGYKRFPELWQEYLPCQKVRDKLVPMKTASPADVALLTLKNTEWLNPPLSLATPEELGLIEAGMKVAYIGYPSESLLPGNNKKPVPVAQQDEVIRVTDFFQTRIQNGPNRLIQHGLPITGGASGSPMINAAGKVVGLISSMNVSRGLAGRMPNAADVNFSQRVDFLYDLFDRQPNETLSRLEKQWRQSMSQYLPGVATSNRAVEDNIIKIFSATGPKTTETINTIKNDANSLGSVKGLISIKKPGLHLVMLTPDQTIKKFKVWPTGQVNLSQYSHPVKYGNFTYYALVIADEPGDLFISFNAAKTNKTCEIGYRIEVTSWDGNINDLIDSYLTYRMDTLADENNSVKLLKKAKNLQMIKEDKDKYLTGFEFELQQKGIYFFLSTPQGQGAVDVVLLDSNGKKIGVDNSPNGIGIKAYKHSGGTKNVQFFSYSKNPAVIQNMSIFFSERM